MFAFTSLGGFERSAFKMALEDAWCRPRDPEVRAEVERWLGTELLPAARDGRACEALLVTVSPDARPASGRLWRLEPGAASVPGEIAFVEEALAAATDARRAAADAATDHWPTPLVESWHAVQVPFPSGRTALPLDGASFGLALALASLSVRCDVPLPRDFIASAAVDADGNVRSVMGLEEKVRVVAEVALGVTRILVAEEVKAEVEAYVRASARSAIEVVGVRSVVEAAQALGLERAFEERLAGRFRDAPEDLVRQLFRAAFDGVPANAWRAFAHTAERVAALAEASSSEPSLVLRARWAARIALRHTGHAAPLDPGELLPGLGLEKKTRALAHAVQSLADSEGDPLDAAREALRRVPSERADRIAAHAELLGAIGRALASAGHLAEACTVLREACETWLALDEEHRATFSFCELVRVLGIEDRDALRVELASRARRLAADKRVDPASRAYVDLALGRAHVMLGQIDEARSMLERLVARETSGDVRASAHRWLARAHGSDDAARALRATLARELADHPTFGMFVRLADLDALLEASGEIAPALERIEVEAATAAWGFEIRRTLRVLRAQGLAGMDLARALADEFRY